MEMVRASIDLKRFREEHCITIEDMMKLSNLSQTALYKYEHNIPVRLTTENKIKDCIERIIEKEEKERYE